MVVSRHRNGPHCYMECFQALTHLKSLRPPAQTTLCCYTTLHLCHLTVFNAIPHDLHCSVAIE